MNDAAETAPHKGGRYSLVGRPLGWPVCVCVCVLVCVCVCVRAWHLSRAKTHDVDGGPFESIDGH